jgi:hypothetical protein
MAIYKYVTAERIDIFKNGHIRFTQPSAFNDPFETFPYFSAFASEDAVDDLIEGQSIEQFEKLMEEVWVKDFQKYGIDRGLMPKAEVMKPLVDNALKEFTMMNTPDSRSRATYTILVAINKAFGILCLTEKRDNLLMWAHYSKNHTGFVIEFDEKHPFFDQRKNERQIWGCLKKVRYAKNRPEMILFDLSKSGEENLDLWARDLFWVKSAHWEYEQEWRMLYATKMCKEIKQNGQQIFLHPIPLECITGIIWGCRIPERVRDFLYLRVKGNKEFSHIRLWQASISEKEYKLDFAEIS